MAKAKTPQIRPSPAKKPVADVFYLFYRENLQQPHTIAMHAHHCWQIEIGLHLSFHLQLKREHQIVEPLGYVLIPPGVGHSFTYDKRGTGYMSMRFDWPLAGAAQKRQILREKNSAQEKSLLRAIIETSKLPETHAETRTAMLETILTALLHFRLPPDTQPSDTTVAGKVKRYLQQAAGKAVTVSEIARELNYSERHTAALFKAETGQPLKSAIDSHRLDEAKKLLLYADVSVSQAAFLLGFTDLFAFSRFFRNHEGISPRQFRKNNE